jgi:hypothetical protein
MDKTGFEREIGFGLTGLALGGGTVVVLPLAAPILRPLAKTAIKGGILAYQGAVILSPKLSRIAEELPRRRGKGRRTPEKSGRDVAAGVELELEVSQRNPVDGPRSPWAR